MIRRIFLVVLALLAALPAAGAQAVAEKPLISPFDTSSLNRAYAPAPISNFRCGKAPAAIRELEFQSIYTDRSEGVSIVDPQALDKYKEDTQMLRLYERRLSEWAGQYTVSGPDEGHPYAACIIDWLYQWAESEALLGKANAQGQAIRKWSLASLSLAYLQIKDAPDLEADKVRLIRAWLNLVAQTVRNDYSRHLDNRTRQNNHLYWAAWGVMAAAVALDDRDLFNWSIEKYKFAVSQISEDGTLPLEMDRMSKAFNYHVFATGPLVMMAETAKVNGIDLYDERDGALHRLIDRILTELETHQAYMTDKTGKKQNITGTIVGAQLAWMEPYEARFHNKRLVKWIKELRPMVQRRLGGNLSLYFAKD